MSGLVRRAGRAVLEGGSTVVWTVSEGRRGRRWREVRTDGGGAVLSSLLLETDPAGRFLHAEHSTATGLLTLHPEGDGTLHGNVVTGDGVRHITGLRWSADSALLVDVSPIALAAVVHAVRGRVIVGVSTSLAVARVTLGLAIALETVDVERVAVDRWRVDDRDVLVDPDALPVFAEASTWPLELESGR
jgi:hypothetical protein